MSLVNTADETATEKTPASKIRVAITIVAVEKDIESLKKWRWEQDLEKQEQVSVQHILHSLPSDRWKRPVKNVSKWYIDSGASTHICNRPSDFIKLDTNKTQASASVVNRTEVKVAGIGTVRYSAVVRGKELKIELRDVLLMLSLMCNLISVSNMPRAGLQVVFDTVEDGKGISSVINKRCRDNLLTALDASGNALYETVMFAEQKHSAMLTSREKTDLSPQRLGHASTSIMEKTLPLVNGIPLDKPETNSSPCESCEKGKSKRSPGPAIRIEYSRMWCKIDATVY